MTTTSTRRAIAAVLVLGACGAAVAAADVPSHPDQLRYPALAYHPPRAAEHRIKLDNGIVAYMVPERSMPLVTVTVLLRAGADLDPAGKEGLAETAMHLLTRGGTKTRTAKDLEDRVAHLGAVLNSGVGSGGGFNPFSGPSAPPVGPSEAFATINLLSKDLDEGLALLIDCLKNPAWEPERLKLRKDDLLQAMKQRNDETANIEAREWGFLMRGDNHWSNRYTTAASVAALGVDDLAAFHRRVVGPKNFILAVSGDFDRAALVPKLQKAFAAWPTPVERPAPPAAPDAPVAAGGWYLVDKDVNQGRVSIGLPALDRYDPDYQAARVMNDILGGGGFSSRLVNRIRSDEGLAYSVRSALEGGTWFQGPWRTTFQSKVRSVAYATQIAMAEVNRMRDTEVGAEELELTKNKFIESLPAQFETATAIANALALEELTGRYPKDPNYFVELSARVRAVTAADVQRVSKRLLDPSKMTVLLVGHAQDMMLGDPKYDASIVTMAGGEPKRLPLRDPMTMKALPVP